MDDLEAILRDELEVKGEEELMKWATCDSAADDALYAVYPRSHVNLLRIKQGKMIFFERLETGGLIPCTS